METNPFTVLVCGGKRFTDPKCLERALNAVHGRRPITTLITGNRAGVEEMSYWWVTQKPLETVITIPLRGFTQMDVIGRYQRIFRTYALHGVIMFDGTSCTDWLHEFAGQCLVKTWVVREDGK